MSVLIKGMEMPSGCEKCPLVDDDARFCKAANEYIPMLGKPAFCPLEESPAGNEWIPCTERLPERQGFYLISGKGTSWIAKWNGEYWASIFFPFVEMEDVDAWQPMPEPWKGKE